MEGEFFSIRVVELTSVVQPCLVVEYLAARQIQDVFIVFFNIFFHREDNFFYGILLWTVFPFRFSGSNKFSDVRSFRPNKDSARLILPGTVGLGVIL